MEIEVKKEMHECYRQTHLEIFIDEEISRRDHERGQIEQLEHQVATLISYVAELVNILVEEGILDLDTALTVGNLKNIFYDIKRR